MLSLNQTIQATRTSKPTKRVSTNSNDLFVHLDTKTVASPLTSPSLSLTVSPSSRILSNNFRLNMSPQQSPLQKTTKQYDSFSQQSLPSPPPPPQLQQQTPNLLLTPSMQHHQMQQSNLLLKTTTNLNTFGRSNTLDRKIKQPQLLSNINKPQTKLVNDDQQFNSNSLERNYNQRQYLVNNQTVNCTNYSQSPHRNSLSISLRSPTSSSRLMTHHQQQQQSKMINETINENGSYLMSSSASSNDIISINSNQSSVQQQQQLKIELDNARNRILTLTNQLNTNVSVYYV